MNTIFERNMVLEKSLSRIWSHMLEHDTGLITAYRSSIYKIGDDGKVEFTQDADGIPVPVVVRSYTHTENERRNYKLRAMLQAERYQVISVEGVYVENFNTPYAKEVKEHVFFVTDAGDRGRLESDLRRMGETMEQDSILFIPRPGDSAVLWGTNKIMPNAFPEYGEKKTYDIRRIGSKGAFFTKVGNKPFMFEKVIMAHVLPEGFFGRWACDTVAKRPWEEI